MVEITLEIFTMIKDAMDAILISETEEFVKNFNGSNGFAFTLDKRLFKIMDNIKYTGHSGSSAAQTLRECQYYLNNHDKWIELQNKFT